MLLQEGCFHSYLKEMKEEKKRIRKEEEGLTDEFEAVARGGGQGPGAGLLAGVSVRPVGAAYCPGHAVDDVVAARWKTHNNGGCVTEEGAYIISSKHVCGGGGEGGGVFPL